MPLVPIYCLQIFCSLFMTGAIWFVQVVHYPLLRVMGNHDPRFFLTIHEHHSRWTTYVVAPVMVLELGSALLLCVDSIQGLSIYWSWILLGLVLATWGATFFVSVPLHGRLGEEFNDGVAKALVQTNWIRTFLWTLKSLILLMGIAWWIRRNGGGELPVIH